MFPQGLCIVLVTLIAHHERLQVYLAILPIASPRSALTREHQDDDALKSI